MDHKELFFEKAPRQADVSLFVDLVNDYGRDFSI